MLSKLKKLNKKYFIITALVIVVALAFTTYYFREKDNSSENIGVISITGGITSSPTYNSDGSINKDNVVALDVVSKIQKANKDRRIKAIVFLIDSSGGDSQSGEEIARAIKEVKKPTVSLIRSQGLSAAYWIASATGHIFASETSDIGSIGVTMSYIDNVNKNQNEGLTFNQLSYGKYKDMGNPDKQITPEEKKLALEQLNKFANIFIKAVAENRHLPIEKVQALADGSSMIAQDALKLGLVDEIGSFREVDRYLSKILKENIEILITTNEIEK